MSSLIIFIGLSILALLFMTINLLLKKKEVCSQKIEDNNVRIYASFVKYHQYMLLIT